MCCIITETKPWLCCCGCSLLHATWFFAICQVLSAIASIWMKNYYGMAYDLVTLVFFCLVLYDPKKVVFRYALYLAQLVSWFVILIVTAAFLIFLWTNDDLSAMLD